MFSVSRVLNHHQHHRVAYTTSTYTPKGFSISTTIFVVVDQFDYMKYLWLFYLMHLSMYLSITNNFFSFLNKIKIYQTPNTAQIRNHPPFTLAVFPVFASASDWLYVLFQVIDNTCVTWISITRYHWPDEKKKR